MKLGIGISVVILAILGTVLYVSMTGLADPPTRATREDVLVEQKWPADLTAPAAGGSGDSAETYLQAVEVYLANRQVLREQSKPDEKLVKQVLDAVTAGLEKGDPKQGWLDDRVPMQPKPKADPEYGDAFQGIVQTAHEHARQVKGMEGYRVGQGLWLMGRRMFTHNVRLSPRLEGLSVAQAGVSLMKLLAQEANQTPPQVDQWGDALAGIGRVWQQKQQTIYALKPVIGDLLRIAEDDKDLTFRLEATLQLGAAQYLTPHASNVRAIQSWLDAQAASSDAMMSQAAKSARVFTREQMH